MNIEQPGAIVFDFDGTCTNAQEEGALFIPVYKAALARLIRQPVEELERIAAERLLAVERQPWQYGWRDGGEIICQPKLDPYQQMMSVAEAVLERFVLPAGTDRATEMRRLYLHAYSHTTTVFRPGAAQVLQACATLPTFVVTNSGTDDVVRKIKTLGDRRPHADNAFAWLMPNVIGDARKNVRDRADLPERQTDPDFLAIPDTWDIPDWPRVIYPRRPQYFRVLRNIRERCQISWSQLLIIGDSPELDLYMAWHLGARVILVANEHTLPCEVDFFSQAERADVVWNLMDILPQLAV